VSAGLGAALLVAVAGWWISTDRRPARAPARPAPTSTPRPAAPELLTLAPIPATRTVRLDSSPGGAAVFDLAGGQVLGQTPLPLEVTVGRRRSVELRLVGHAPRRVELAADGSAVPVVDLVPLQPRTGAATGAARDEADRPRPGGPGPPRETRRIRKRPRPVMAPPAGKGASVTVNPFD
jgi:hypothetical protein